MTQHIQWEENGQSREALWRSEGGVLPPKRVQIADDTLTADAAYRLACEGTALLWRGDFQNARQLLQAMARRFDRTPRKRAASLKEAFNQQRMTQAQRARTLGMLLINFEASYALPLRRAPDVRAACEEAWGQGGNSDVPCVVSLRELQGLIGAHEWRKKGVPIPALGTHIHPHYGVFSPVRGEYVQLVADAPLPKALTQDSCAFDIGTGTGVLAAVLAKRGFARIVATDQDERAIACARQNAERIGMSTQIDVVKADLFPDGKASLIVCNPPWVPGKVTAALDAAIYDPESRMLKGFLAGLAKHLAPGGEGWLILSDLAEHIGLRSRGELQGWIEAGGLKVLGRLDARPVHGKAFDATDPLHAARAVEVTSLWRLAVSDSAL